MLIFPAIDLKGGRCVRLRQGRKEDETVFSDNAVAMGLKWQDLGAQCLHVVDLPVIASWGVSSLNNIKALLPLEPLGVVGVIIGRTLYDGIFQLPEALKLTHAG